MRNRGRVRREKSPNTRLWKFKAEQIVQLHIMHVVACSCHLHSTNICKFSWRSISLHETEEDNEMDWFALQVYVYWRNRNNPVGAASRRKHQLACRSSGIALGGWSCSCFVNRALPSFFSAPLLKKPTLANVGIWIMWNLSWWCVWISLRLSNSANVSVKASMSWHGLKPEDLRLSAFIFEFFLHYVLLVRCHSSVLVYHVFSFWICSKVSHRGFSSSHIPLWSTSWRCWLERVEMLAVKVLSWLWDDLLWRHLAPKNLTGWMPSRFDGSLDQRSSWVRNWLWYSLQPLSCVVQFSRLHGRSRAGSRCLFRVRDVNRPEQIVTLPGESPQQP